MGDTVPEGPEEIQGTRQQIALMHQKNAITEVPSDSPGFYSNILGMQGFRRVASSNRFKKSERSHLCASFLYVHHKLSSEYRPKMAITHSK